MNPDEQQKSSNEIVKFVLSSSNGNPLQIEVQMPVYLHKIRMYEAQTQTISDPEMLLTSANESDVLSKEAGDEARLTGHNKYGLLSLDEYQITRTGEEHCLKKYFSDDDISLDDDGDDEEMIASKKNEEIVEQQLNQMHLDDAGDTTVRRKFHYGDYAQNNSAMVDTGENEHLASRSDLSTTLLLDDTTPLSATLAQSTSSRVSHSRVPQTHRDEEEEEEDDDELDRLVASTFIPSVATNHDDEALQVVTTLHDELTQLETQLPLNHVLNAKDNDSISSVRWYVRQALDSCRQNLSLVDELLERLPFSSSIPYEHVLRRKVRRPNWIMTTSSALKGLKYYPSSGVQTE